MQAKLMLNDVQKIKDFVKKTETLPYNADVSSGRYVVDSKSLLGIFSLNLSEPVMITIHASDEECSEFMGWLKANCYTVETWGQNI